MSNVDWSKAPEGATHYNGGARHKWRMQKDGEWHAWVSGEEEWIAIPDPIPSLYRPIDDGPTAELNGKGLPPVGAVVEWFSPAYGWLGGRVVGHEGAVAVISHNDGYTGCLPHRVRQIRTAEQLAAEARERAINEMRHIAEHDAHSRAVDYGALYDAGYRKLEQPE